MLYSKCVCALTRAINNIKKTKYKSQKNSTAFTSGWNNWLYLLSIITSKISKKQSSVLSRERTCPWVPEHPQGPGPWSVMNTQRTGSQAPGSTGSTQTRQGRHRMDTHSLRNAMAKASREKINLPFYPNFEHFTFLVIVMSIIFPFMINCCC